MMQRAYYVPRPDGVEHLPTALHLFHTRPLIMRGPHWHAQVEVNFIVRGWAHYRMSGYDIRFAAGELALFWGGRPHWLDDASDDLVYAGGHLPLVHFFRLRLPQQVQAQLMQGATLLTGETDAADAPNFERWHDYVRSGDPMKASIAVDELLLRIERIRFGAYTLVPGGAAVSQPAATAHVSPIILRICDYVGENFRENIDSVDIAGAAGVHPKYAMALFKKSTGMTLNDYLSLMRLSFAQSLLMRDEANVLSIAMDSGFGSLSAFNKAFRRIAGTSPSDFRRDVRARPMGAGERRVEAEMRVA